MQGRNELCAVLVYSDRANGRIKEIDFSALDNSEGIYGHISAQDVSEQENLWGAIIQDEPVFAYERVSHHGQVIAALLCSSYEVGKNARSMVRVIYDNSDDTPAASVYGLNDVLQTSGISGLEKVSNFGGAQRLRRYLDNESMCSRQNSVEGIVNIGGQHHFYLEPHNVLVVPVGEKDEYIVYSGNQVADGVQGKLAKALGIPKNKVTVRTKRTGGAFGGKERYILILRQISRN